jgi:hypothetical protein
LSNEELKEFGFARASRADYMHVGVQALFLAECKDVARPHNLAQFQLLRFIHC